MKFNTEHLDKIYNCNWIQQKVSPKGVLLICQKCYGNDGTNLNGNKLEVIIEFYNDFYKEHGKCDCNENI